MKKIFTWIKNHLPTKRRVIQLYAALLANANIKGFLNGSFYIGPTKYACTPGLNCYSCPGATGACPLGSLQNALMRADKSMLYYVLGIIFVYGIMLGRWICGFLCPFGLIQDLLHKIKTPKLPKSRVTRILSYLKYVILGYLVIIVPLSFAAPGFCKYICPAGTLGGAVGLSLNSDAYFADFGFLFTWKFVILVACVVLAIFIYRFFCRFFCPLGAIYGLFNRFALLGIKLEDEKCVNCGLCQGKCKMDIRRVGDHECINCGECIDVCPTKAISWRGSKVFLRPNEFEIPADADAETVASIEENKQKTLKKRHRIAGIVVSVLMVALLGGALVYYNFLHEGPAVEQVIPEGNCPSFEAKVFDENGLTGDTFDPSKNYGKVTVINFWGTWCSGCVHELPYFDRVADEYADSVTVVAFHTDYIFNTAADFVGENYPDSKIIFVKDELLDPSDKFSSDYYYTTLGGVNEAYPMTVILDANGNIFEHYTTELTYDELKAAVERALG